jgi:type 1 fimbria pilin
MGNVSTDQLEAGTTPEKTFNVGINCPGGARVAMAFSDNSEPSNTSNTLTISKNSEAAGIGLQLRKDSTPITYNASNSNMILVAELANAGVVNVPLVAKVVKTGPVRVGRFNAQSTITLGYQ